MNRNTMARDNRVVTQQIAPADADAWLRDITTLPQVPDSDWLISFMKAVVIGCGAFWVGFIACMWWLS